MQGHGAIAGRTALVAGCVALTIVATAVLLPVAADAAGSAVTIRDGKLGGRLARVTKQGKLLVGDGNGPLDITGSVRATLQVPANPVDTINNQILNDTTGRRVLFQGTGNRKLAISSITFAAKSGSAGAATVHIQVYVDDTGQGNCLTLTGGSFGAAERFTVIVPFNDTVNITYPSPLVWTAYADAGEKYCVNAELSSGLPANTQVYVSASGFRL